MDGNAAGAAASISQSLSGISTLMSSMGYMLGIGFGIKAAMSLKEHNDGEEGASMSKFIALACMAGAMFGFPTFMTTAQESMFGAMEKAEKQVNIQAASEKAEKDAVDKGAPETVLAGADKAAEDAPLAKVEAPTSVEKTAENPVTTVASAAQAQSTSERIAAKMARADQATARKPILIEKLATPEQARAAADRKAMLEVLFGVAIALAVGAAVWIAAKRKRAASPAQALPEVQFLDGGNKAVFAEGDIFAKTAAFDKAKAPGEQP